jgi:hypothetical protein
MARKPICPLLRKPCIEHDCAWWTTIRGYDTNTGKELDQQLCIVSSMPFLLIENSAQQRSTGAAVESMRNEMANRTDVTNTLLANVVVGARVSQLPEQPIEITELLPPSNG